MAPKCTICQHPDRELIDQRILAGESTRSIAVQYNIAHTSVQRHKQHIPGHLIRAKEAEVVTQADDLMSDLFNLRDTAIRLLGKAELAEDLRAAAPLINSACKVVEILAEVRGQLDRKAEVNIFLNPQYMQVQAVILQELQDYPELRSRLANRLAEVTV